MLTYQQWLESNGCPKPPSKYKKLNRKETSYSRDLRNDLSKDYRSNAERHGDVGPFKLLGKSKKKST